MGVYRFVYFAHTHSYQAERLLLVAVVRPLEGAVGQGADRGKSEHRRGD